MIINYEDSTFIKADGADITVAELAEIEWLAFYKSIEEDHKIYQGTFVDTTIHPTFPKILTVVPLGKN